MILTLLASIATATAARAAIADPAGTGSEPAPRLADGSAGLDGTQWSVELRPAYQGGPEEFGNPLTDTLRYEQGQVRSAWLDGEGYAPGQVALATDEEGEPVWEALQLNERDGLAFWQGSFSGEEMRGVLSRHALERPGLDFLFVGRIIRSALSSEAPVTEPGNPADRRGRRGNPEAEGGGTDAPAFNEPLTPETPTP